MTSQPCAEEPALPELAAHFHTPDSEHITIVTSGGFPRLLYRPTYASGTLDLMQNRAGWGYPESHY